jgi:hypothetical protein
MVDCVEPFGKLRAGYGRPVWWRFLRIPPEYVLCKVSRTKELSLDLPLCADLFGSTLELEGRLLPGSFGSCLQYSRGVKGFCCR